MQFLTWKTGQTVTSNTGSSIEISKVISVHCHRYKVLEGKDCVFKQIQEDRFKKTVSSAMPAIRFGFE